jgi:transposase
MYWLLTRIGRQAVMTHAARPWLVDDALWALVEPLLPVRPRRTRHPGRRPLDDRLVLQGILFVLHTGIGWEHLPHELGFGSGMTAWPRVRGWHQAGVWKRLHEQLLTRLQTAAQIDWSRAIIDASYVQAKKGGSGLGPSPVDPGRAGVKHHVLIDGHASRSPGPRRLRITTTSPSCPRSSTRSRTCPAASAAPRHRPARLIADRGYDHDLYRRQLSRRGIKPLIARRRTEHGSGLGRERWTVERTISHRGYQNAAQGPEMHKWIEQAGRVPGWI